LYFLAETSGGAICRHIPKNPVTQIDSIAKNPVDGLKFNMRNKANKVVEEVNDIRLFMMKLFVLIPSRKRIKDIPRSLKIGLSFFLIKPIEYAVILMKAGIVII